MHFRTASLLVALVLACASAAGASPSASADPVGIRRTDAADVARTADLVATAISFLGVPYRRGGNSAESGFDCSGFVRATYKDTIGLLLPRRAEEQATATQEIDRGDLKPGDLVFFRTVRRTFSHVGIYVGEGKFIHAPKPGARVRMEDMDGRYWQRRFSGARRVHMQNES